MLDVSLIFPIYFVFSINCMCYASTFWQFAYGAYLYMNTQYYVLVFLHVLWIPLCHSNKGDLNNYTLARLSLHIKDCYGIFWNWLFWVSPSLRWPFLVFFFCFFAADFIQCTCVYFAQLDINILGVSFHSFHLIKVELLLLLFLHIIFFFRCQLNAVWTKSNSGFQYRAVIL